ncbi:MAG: hypothetical protein GEV13_27815 [Rhodospirillales bacterium]|nr:hypothetical protein [Rhodospirillales bacterium]
MPNFLEQLVAEWFEFQHYFVRRNVRVGKREKGGYESELDVVAFNPEKQHLVHVEPSMDADPWEKRERRFGAKFAAGQKHIPSLFIGFSALPKLEQIALLGFAGQGGRSTLGGGRILLIGDFMNQIRADIAHPSIRNNAIPEQYVILRSLQYAANYWKTPAGLDA